ncbi:tripartite tricarboxylate transporter substrate binding protein [Variovorax sp. J31P207]|uniref:tripartite tricarboxylate transporter substrate binding protein n=1 Tax=Variovorax sp. J31P207 TaxID=3053510 RepID=UPI00257634D9|nr:tripartite tricarboxylate transporter substrate binding protein [Variovorax sp. J31P207]MDM0072442.1 tripartite tricarboxylate transporter substrate binding protein [Variovorax sp. J31P207]
MRTKIRMLVAALAAGFAVAALAQPAEKYPRQPIRMVVTFPPGGSSDAVVRMLVPRLNESLGQPVIVDNRPGAGGNIGTSVVAKAQPDGYTMGVVAAGALSANSSLYAQMPFDVQKDLRPVSMLASIPFVLVGNPAVPAKTLQDLIARAKAHPGELTVAHGGNGTAMHLSIALFSQMAGVKLVEVPYKGSGPAALDAIGGQVNLAMVDLPSALQQIRAGKLTAYAVTTPKRLSQLPEVPTMSEAGVPGYDSTGWFGVVAPAATPTGAVARMNVALTEALADPVVQANIRNLGVEPTPGSPEELASFITSETAKWAKVIKQSNIKID